MADTITISGLNELVQSLLGVNRSVHTTIGESFHTSHEEVMAMAKERTPVDTGALQESGMVKPSEISGDTITSIGSFGGGDIDYALEVHENLGVHHNVGQAKYYESACEDHREEVLQQLNNDFLALLSKSITSHKSSRG